MVTRKIFRNKQSVTKSDSENLLRTYIRKVTSGEVDCISFVEGMDEETVEAINEMILAIKAQTTPMILALNDSLELATSNSIVDDMLNTVDHQVVSIQDMEHSSTELGNSIKSIGDVVNKLTEHVNQVTVTTSKSISTMLESIHEVQDSTEEVKKFNEMIQSFKSKTSKIDEIIDIVKRVAKESSLLALNASIEAARAGVAGRGFTIVAEQMRDLAGSTAVSAEDISKYIKELQQEIDGLVATVNVTTSNLESSNTAISHVASDIQEINGNTEKINLQINDIYAYVEEQSATLDFFMESIHSLSDTCNQTQINCKNTGTFIYNFLRQCDLVRGKLFKNISNLTMKEKLRVYAVDHMMFSWGIANVIEGYREGDLDKIHDYSKCRFGLFAYSEENPDLKKDETFQQAVLHHKQLHELAMEAATASQQNRKEEARRLFSEHKVYLSKFIDALGQCQVE